MSDNCKTFSIDKYIFTFGPIIVSGWAPGTFVSIKYDSPHYVETEGTDGEVCRVLRKKFKATITFSLMQSSKINELLSAALIADIGGASIPLPFITKDLNGNTVGIATQCWIPQLPDTAFADESVPREWTIKAAKLDLLVGGNFT